MSSHGHTDTHSSGHEEEHEHLPPEVKVPEAVRKPLYAETRRIVEHAIHHRAVELKSKIEDLIGRQKANELIGKKEPDHHKSAELAEAITEVILKSGAGLSNILHSHDDLTHPVKGTVFPDVLDDPYSHAAHALIAEYERVVVKGSKKKKRRGNKARFDTIFINVPNVQQGKNAVTVQKMRDIYEKLKNPAFENLGEESELTLTGSKWGPTKPITASTDLGGLYTSLINAKNDLKTAKDAAAVAIGALPPPVAGAKPTMSTIELMHKSEVEQAERRVAEIERKISQEQKNKKELERLVKEFSDYYNEIHPRPKGRAIDISKMGGVDAYDIAKMESHITKQCNFELALKTGKRGSGTPEPTLYGWIDDVKNKPSIDILADRFTENPVAGSKVTAERALRDFLVIQRHGHWQKPTPEEDKYIDYMYNQLVNHAHAKPISIQKKEIKEAKKEKAKKVGWKGAKNNGERLVAAKTGVSKTLGFFRKLPGNIGRNFFEWKGWK